MSLYDVATFDEFWPLYVRLHSRRVTQWLHALATLAAATVIVVALLARRPWLVLLAPLVDYAIAQLAHRLFQHNRTQPWRDPRWHLRAELRMFRLVVTGRMGGETRRHARA